MSSMQGKLLVVIDDDRAVLEAMDGLLQSWGFSVVIAATETEALEGLSNLDRRPDLIIADHRLADGKFGLQAIQRLREVFEIPALIVTGDERSVVEQESGVPRGQLLFKPLDPDLLKDAVNHALKKKL